MLFYGEAAKAVKLILIHLGANDEEQERERMAHH